jgi:hypothetical protein
MMSKKVQVILELRGQQSHMAVSDRISEKDFKKEAKKRLSIPKLTHTRIEAVGLDTWGVRAGYVYAVMETKKMTLHLHDVSGQVHHVQIEGDKSLTDLCNQLRVMWGFDPWITITVARMDKHPFWVENKGEYTVVTQHDPNLDPRPLCTIGVDLIDRTLIIPDYQAVDYYGVIWADLCTKYGF